MINLYSSIHQPVHFFLFFFNQWPSYRSLFCIVFLFWSNLLFFPSYQRENNVHRSNIPNLTEMILEPLLSVPQLHFPPSLAYKHPNCFEFHFAFFKFEVMTRLEGEILSKNWVNNASRVFCFLKQVLLKSSLKAICIFLFAKGSVFYVLNMKVWLDLF